MAALELEWIPETLYNTAISAVVDNYSRSRRDIRSLPENTQFDVYYKEGEEWTRSPVRILPRPEITFLNNHQKC
ncbi:Amyloid protein-binding protein 2 [Salmo salar]|uniref:Amyloid protein-binding protein 2 n=1 Tax=Salmo salar TaxID=8030 RepID=B5X6J5_SALSA|nr:Amyloid protein-binding protein 2 [Salmo salar]ACI66465.1 Amyloid protein-binding protein 2 [Salmo salar]|eukprot:NP_001134173.1 Amyloid protein-binding protein 2 [Salmo salar]